MNKFLAIITTVSILSLNSMWADFGRYESFTPYVGITGGIDYLSGDYTALSTDGSGDRHLATAGKTQGLIGGVIGIQKTFCNNIYTAIQGNALYNTANQKIRTSTNTSGVENMGATQRNHFLWGVDFRLGYTVCNVTPYLLGGFESSYWSLGLNNNSGSDNRGIPANSVINIGKTLWGGKVGGGVAFPITCQLSANIEYSYTWFGNISRDLTASNQTWNHSTNVRQGSFLVGLNYSF
jgi:opacity protein-like surface antigen